MQRVNCPASAEAADHRPNLPFNCLASIILDTMMGYG
jgi:hypothetical protein